MTPEFIPFPKIPRLNRMVVVTEKIDGTNAQIHITDDGNIIAGSRTRWIKPGDDNFAFALWVENNKEELLKLGPGSHFGEWWGKGIQRGYGMETRKFSLFNTHRWIDPEMRPSCCDVVPMLYAGDYNQDAIDAALESLRVNGSKAAPGFMDPEGIVVYHTAANQYFKATCKDDNKPKMWKELNGVRAA